MKRFYRSVCRHSDIVSNLMMMVCYQRKFERHRISIQQIFVCCFYFSSHQIWSIIFRNWSSIVFLLVVSVLWTRPIQKKTVHRINSFIVLYANVLLILHYFHCMTNTTNNELPAFFYRTLYANLFPIDIVQYDAFECVPLLFQTICVFTFCFTLRQDEKNKHRNRGPNRFSASFQITSEEGQAIWKCFEFGANVLAHIWVAMILCTMFIYAVYGNEVNVLKFSYMIYVLIFVTTFQLSIRIWRKMLYSFWMLVIISSMINLILIYTYQFDGVEHFWTHFMAFDTHMQVFF